MALGLLTERIRKTFELRIATRFIVAFIILGMVISSPIFMLVNPAQVSAASVNDNSKRIDSSGYHSTPSIPEATASPLSSPTSMVPAATNLENNGDFTTQAALTGVSSRQTNNIVGAQSYYDVVFTTSTTGTIKFIDITFPAGTVIGAAPLLAEREGIGTGTAAKTSATEIRYTVTSAVSVPAGTKIRLEFFNLVNPTLPNAYKVTVTTRTAGGTTIDGPTLSNSLNMKQMGSEQIADKAVTTPKLASGAVTPDIVSPGDFLGTNVMERTAGSGPIDPGATKSATASCEEGEVATGGGYSKTDNIDVVDSHRNINNPPSNDWRITAKNPSSTVGGVTAIVECVRTLP